MKKKYFEPQLDVVTIQTRSIICTSSLGMGDDTSTAGIIDADAREFEDDFENDEFDMGEEDI